MGVSSFGLLQSMIFPVLSQVQERFDADQATVAWVLTAYLVSAAVATPLIGRIGDAVGKQRMLVVTLALLAAGSVVAAVAPTIEWLIAARVVQGVGGGVLPLSFGIVNDEVPPERSGAAVGLLAALISAAFGVGVVLAGPIVEGWGYVWLFWLPAMATSLASVAAVLFIRSSPVRASGRVGLGPAVWLSGWLITLLLAIGQGNELGWTSSPVVGLLVAAAAMMVGWILAERRAVTPLIDLALMRVRGVWTANVVAFAQGFGTFASLGFLPQLLQTPTASGYGFGQTISESGRVLVPSLAVSFVMGFVAPRLVRTLTARRVIFGGLIAQAAASAGLAMFHEHTWQIIVVMVVMGVGIGTIGSSLAIVILALVPAHQSGMASGMNANLRMIGGAVGTATLAGIIEAHAGPAGVPLEVGYRNGFLLLAVVFAVGAAVALIMPPGTRRPRGLPQVVDASFLPVGCDPRAER